jgi:cerevisin
MFVFEFPVSLSGTVGGQIWDRQAGHIISVKCLNQGSGTGAGIVAAIDWITRQQPRPNGAVINMSLGTSSFTILLTMLWKEAVAAGVHVVVAAGNSNQKAWASPASATNASGCDRKMTTERPSRTMDHALISCTRG